MENWLCSFDLENADEEDYNSIYIKVHKGGGVRFWKNDGKYYRYPSTSFKLPIDTTDNSNALDKLEKFLKSCTEKNTPHIAVGGTDVTARSVPVEEEAVPEEIRELIG
ncbi:MAG: hypothetical protein WC947_08140 [Elusimicrobiota bacterium]